MISPVSCQSYGENGDYHSVYSQEISCLISSPKGYSTLLAIASFIALTFHIYAGLIFELFNFPVRLYNFQKLPKRNNVDEFFVKITAMLMIYSHTNMIEKLKTGLIIILAASFITIFLLRRNFGSIMDESQNKFILTSNAFNVWFSFVLMIQYFCNSIYDANWIIFLISFISLLATLFIKNEDDCLLEILNKNPNEIKSSWGHLVYLETICLVYRKSFDGEEKSKILLDGLIENIQNQTDDEANTPLNFENIWNGNMSYSEFDLREKKALLEYLSVRYLKAISEFQGDENLNISFACFLMDFMKKRNLAYEHLYSFEKSQQMSSTSLYKIEMTKTAFHETDEDSNQRKFGKKISVPKYIRERMMLEFSKMLEKSTTEFIYLWQTILDENPPIKKVYSGIKDSQKSIQNVLDYWESNSNIFQRRPEAKLMMGRFLRDVIDQTKEGEKMIDESFTLIKKKHEDKFNIENLNYLSDIENLQLPCFIVNQPIRFVSCNKIFCMKMAYTLSEFTKKNLEDLIPMKNDLARKYLEEIFQKVEKNPKKILKGKILPFLKKNGFLMVNVCDIKLSKDTDNQKYLTVICHQDKFIQPKAHILIDEKGSILTHNSSVCSVLNTKNIFLSEMKIKNIQQLIDIKVKDLKKISSQKNLKINSVLEEEHRDQGSIFEELENNLFLELTDLSLKEKRVYLVSITSSRMTDKFSESNPKSSRRNRYKRVRNKGFYFKLDGNPTLAYYGGFDKEFAFEKSNINFTQMPVEDISQMDNSCRILYKIKHPEFSRNPSSENFQQKIDYSDGIRVKRLMQNGNIIDWYQGIDDDDSEFGYEEEKEIGESKKKTGKVKFEKKSSLVVKRKKRNIDEEDDDDGFRALDNINNKSNIFLMLKGLKMQGSLKCLIFLIIVFYLVLAVFNVFITLSRSTISGDLKGFANIDSAATFRNSDMSAMLNIITDICLRNQGTNFEYGLEGDTTTVEQKNLRDLNDLREYLTKFEEKNSVILETIETLSLKEDFSNFYNAKNVTIYKGGRGQKFSIAEGVRQVITSSVTLLQIDPGKITFDQPDVEFILNNTLGQLLEDMVNFVNLNDLLRPITLEKQASTKLITRSFLIAVSIFGIFIFYIAYYFYYSQRENFVDTFYGFNVKMAEMIISKSEKYIQFLQRRESEGEIILEFSDNSDNEKENEFNSGENKKKINFEDVMSQLRRRKKKGTLKPKLGLERIITILILLGSTGLLALIFSTQEGVIENSALIIDSVERIALTETMIWNGVNSLQMSLYDVGGNYRRSPSIVDTILFTSLSFSQNDDTLKVSKIIFKNIF